MQMPLVTMRSKARKNKASNHKPPEVIIQDEHLFHFSTTRAGPNRPYNQHKYNEAGWLSNKETGLFVIGGIAVLPISTSR